MCAEGYKGWLCSKCDQKFYPVFNSCLPCPEIEWLCTELVLICCFCAIVFVVVFRLYKKEKNLAKPKRSSFDIIISRGKLVLGFYQVVGEFFASVHEVNWATALKFLGSIVSVIELNIFRVIVRPKCFNERLQLNPKIEFMIGIMFPCALVLLSLVLYRTMKARYKYKRGLTGTSESLYIYTKRLRSNLWTSVIILLFVTYPSICTTVFQMYPKTCVTFCLDMSNTICEKRLRSDYEIECTNLEIYHILAFISTALYVVGFPVGLFLLLKNKIKYISLHGPPGPLYAETDDTGRHRQNLVDESTTYGSDHIWMEFLCENYKPQFWYWEIVEITRKITQTVLITLLGWENVVTVFLTIGMSLLYLMLNARYRPMKSTTEQLLQVFCFEFQLFYKLYITGVMKCVPRQNCYFLALTISILTFSKMIL
ncbi:hypothetical protein HOLleu_04208 [Holothuria leucospilota]|uniref:Uncharacterized protein n=1 Tax=Holothuria leucospilota TaxID=206669 RepID=A0A9Q1HLR1_HOLLE|nr:hypothetical protein HOLleu_04208 [Holothuria leucospilota]